MLAGFVVLGQAVGTFSLREMLADPARPSPITRGTRPIVVLVLLGAFTKSAQFPFHFWLPNAMAAPTPVSAYLHSATMVKAGVFLLARLTPVLGGTELWMETLTAVGAVTAVYSAFVSLGRSDLKQVLAYTTVMALGVCVMFLGSPPAAGQGEPSRGVLAALAFLVAHALYKAALFMVAGTIEKATGTRDLTRLGGLRKAMPVTFAAAVAASVSMAGVPPSFGFIGKELLYTVGFAPGADAWLPWAVFLAAAPVATVAMVLAIGPFFGPRPDYPKPGREGHWALWCGPVVLGAAGLWWGLSPGFPFTSLLVPADDDGDGAAPARRPRALAQHGRGPGPDPRDAGRGGPRDSGSGRRSRRALAGGRKAGSVQRRPRLRRGHERHRRRRRLADPPAAVRRPAALSADRVRHTRAGPGRDPLDQGRGPRAGTVGGNATFLDWSLAALVAAASLVIIRSRSRLLGICALGVVGVATALIFLTFGAPDVAMTQMVVETLVTVIVAIVLLKLPDFRNEIWPSRPARLSNAVVAVTIGICVTLVLLAVTGSPPQPDLREYFERTAVPGGQGRNIVNVILVDFRALVHPGGDHGARHRRRGGLRPPDAGSPAAGGRAAPGRGGSGGARPWRGTAASSEHHDPAGDHPPAGPVDSRVLRLPAAAGPRAPRRRLRRRAGRGDRVQPVRLRLRPAGGPAGCCARTPARSAPSAWPWPSRRASSDRCCDTAPFLTGQWGTLAGLKIGTPVMFDVGVYLVVIGVVLTFVIGLKSGRGLRRGNGAASGGGADSRVGSVGGAERSRRRRLRG